MENKNEMNGKVWSLLKRLGDNRKKWKNVFSTEDSDTLYAMIKRCEKLLEGEPNNYLSELLTYSKQEIESRTSESRDIKLKEIFDETPEPNIWNRIKNKLKNK